MLLEVVFLLLTTVLLWALKQTSRSRKMLAKFPGPRSYPIVGNALQMGSTSSDFMSFLERNCKKYFGMPYAFWVGSTVFVILSDPKDIEIILGSNKLLDKGEIYRFFQPWLGSGLLTSTGAKWRKHRKIITPTFHFKILEEFIDVFNANSSIMVEKMKKEVNGPGFDIYNYVTLCALDIIAESSMGVQINAQLDSESEYVKAYRDIADVMMKRITQPWYANAFIFNCSKYKRIQDEALKILHGKTNSVISIRKEELAKERTARDVCKNEEDISQSDGVKKRLAFLDMLIESTLNGSQLSDEDIRDEVETFMFEGHDTTSSGISFALWVMSWHQKEQEDVFQELQEVFPDPDKPITFRGLQDLKCMDRFIKEAQRVYPSVPFFARQMNEDVELPSGLVIPKDAMALMPIFMTHRNPEIFADPDKFDPERFLPENILGRHPYSYVPFSAGPRNCIGQKFAMLEMKSAIAHVLRDFKLVPGTEKPNLVLSSDLVLISTTGITVKIVPRKI